MAQTQKRTEASPDEYKVYEAVLGLMNHIPKKDPKVTIYDATLNSKCGSAASPAPLANGCTFLWLKPATPDTVKQVLHSNGFDMQDSTWSDFVKENAETAWLHEPISTPWKHELVGVGAEPTKGWNNPDLTVFLSRVGFNPAKTEAVVYVLVFSYMHRVPTEGDYFLFRLDNAGHWNPEGRLTYLKIGKDGSSQ